MPRNLGNGINTFYGQQTILAPAGQAASILYGSAAAVAQSIINGGGGAQSIAGASGIAALTEYAGNGKVYGTSSLAIGQDGAGNSVILARGAQSLSIGANTGGQISIASNGTVSIPAPASGTTLNLTGVAGGNAFVVTGAAASGNSFGIACSAGTTSADRCALFTNQANTQVYALLAGDGSLVMGSATGGTKGLGTINATGIYVNGVAVGGGATIGVMTIAFNGGSAPTISSSKNLGASPSVTRSAIGTYAINHNMGIANYVMSGVMNNGGANVYIPQMNVSNTNTINLTTFAQGVGVADPANTYVLYLMITTG